MTGVMPEALKVPAMPNELEYLWRYYVDIRNAEPVTFSSVKAFSDLMCLNLEPNEVSVIMEFEKKYKEVF